MRVLFKDDAQSLHEIIDSIAGYQVPANHKSSTPLDFWCRCKRGEFQSMLTNLVGRNKYALWDQDKVRILLNFCLRNTFIFYFNVKFDCNNIKGT